MSAETIQSRRKDDGEIARLKAVNADLLAALEYAEREIDGLYEAFASGQAGGLVISIGQWGRLDTIRAAIAKARS